MSAFRESRLLIRHSRSRFASSASLSAGEAPAPLPSIVLPGIALRPEPLARGSLATIYRGWDRTHRCAVVVKVQRATDDPVALRRFEREAAVMLRLRHPSIVTLYAFHPGHPEADDPAALVMEYVPGMTLAARAAEGRLPVGAAVQIVADVAAALDCAHALGVVHRDVKPSNILLPKRGLLGQGPAKLTDFGVARMGDDSPLTVMGDILGTIEYASPEQVHGTGGIDSRSDVYSLAAVAYFALTGTPPFRAADSSTQAQLSVMHRQVFAEPPPLRLHRADLPAALEEVVLRGLAKAPEDRYVSAGQLAAALCAALAASSGEPHSAAAESSAWRTGAAAGALAAAVLLMGLGIWLSRTGPKPAKMEAKTFPPFAASRSRPASSKPPVVKSSSAAAAKFMAAKPAPVKIAAKPRAAKSLPRRTSPAKLLLTASSAAPAAARTSAPAFKKSVLVKKSIQAKKITPTPAQEAAVPVRRPMPVKKTLLTATVAPIMAAKKGWYTVSGWAALPGQSAIEKPQMLRVNPVWVKVDGQAVPSLASGQWAALKAGTHQVTFQPALGMGAGPKTWTIYVAPSRHLNQQVPLPIVPLPAVPPHLRTSAF